MKEWEKTIPFFDVPASAKMPVLSLEMTGKKGYNK